MLMGFDYGRRRSKYFSFHYEFLFNWIFLTNFIERINRNINFLLFSHRSIENYIESIKVIMIVNIVIIKVVFNRQF